MPRESLRKTHIRDYEQHVLALVVFGSLDDLSQALNEYNQLLSKRYVSPRMKAHSDDYFFETHFPNLSDAQFRSKFRTTREGFATLTTLIENHPAFHNNSRHKQIHPGWQLAVALYRFGHYGNAMCVEEVACHFGIGKGTIADYTRRVMQALLAIANDWLVWPDSHQRREHGVFMREEGFPGCVGFVDRTTINLSQKPHIQGAGHFDRKKR